MTRKPDRARAREAEEADADEAAWQELVASYERHGIAQPILCQSCGALMAITEVATLADPLRATLAEFAPPPGLRDQVRGLLDRLSRMDQHALVAFCFTDSSLIELPEPSTRG